MRVLKENSSPTFGGTGTNCLKPLKSNSLKVALKEEIIRIEAKSKEANDTRHESSSLNKSECGTPWFPVHISDLDKVLPEGSCVPDLEPEHAGFSDPLYRARRKNLATIAFNFKHGDAIPRVSYSAVEVSTWRQIYRRVTSLYPSHACGPYLQIFPELVEKCGYAEDKIPQLQDVSDFIKARTGFSIRPATGLLTPRDFLAGLAHRVIYSTQYIRHHSSTHYTPEPDICHDLLGHIPLLAHKDFADFSQEFGLASLGAPDEDIDKLAACYWFTAEFGLFRENGELRAFGAGLLSSYGELAHCLSGRSQVKEFNPEVAGIQAYPSNGYQPLYFVTESFADAKEKLVKFAREIERPFSVRYNHCSSRVDTC